MRSDGKIYHDDWMNNGLPDKSVQLIIADPPYFETKGEFDFVWNTFEEYLKDVEKWANECKSGDSYGFTVHLDCCNGEKPKQLPFACLSDEQDCKAQCNACKFIENGIKNG